VSVPHSSSESIVFFARTTSRHECSVFQVRRGLRVERPLSIAYTSHMSAYISLSEPRRFPLVGFDAVRHFLLAASRERRIFEARSENESRTRRQKEMILSGDTRHGEIFQRKRYHSLAKRERERERDGEKRVKD